jgi:hypothetical protein
MFVAGVNLNIHQAGPLKSVHVIDAQIEELLLVRVDVDTVYGVSQVQAVFGVPVEAHKRVEVSQHHVEVKSEAPVVIVAVFRFGALLQVHRCVLR